jgi:putative NADH-flavin reductase
MKAFVLGGTGRTGRLIAEGLVAKGHAVSVGGRRDPRLAGAAFVSLDPMNGQELRAAVAGADCVVSALASGKCNPVCSAAARALSQIDGLRFVTIGGAGVDAATDDKGLGDKAVGFVMRLLVREMLADRQLELAILQQSGLKWTMLRPPRLTDDKGGHKVAVTFDRPASTAIARADLARTAIEVLGDDSLIGRAPFVAGVK